MTCRANALIGVVALTLACTPASSSSAAGTGPETLLPVSPRHLVVALDQELEPDVAVSEWTLRSEEDAAYAGGVHPDAVAVKARARELVPVGWPYPAVREYEVVLALPAPLLPGATYTVTWQRSGASWTLAFDPATTFTPAIHNNQVGYLATAPARFAYVSYWLASLPPLALAPGERAFVVVDETTRATALEGTLGLRKGFDEPGDDAYDDNYTHANVYEADLSDLDRPGRYHLVWKGVGRSETFTVGAGVYDAPFRAAFRALYHQRCGTALEEPHTRFTHRACHQATVERTRADYHRVGADAFGPLQAEATGEHVSASGGYHDAGDYDRRIEHLTALDALVDLYELDPERFAGDGFDLPESGNGVPDLLDEARWAIGLYAALQQADGGVPAGVETTGYPGWTTPPEEDDDTPWFAYAADPRSSFRFAGGAAKLARALGPFDAAAADTLLDEARAAWSWATAHRDGVPYDCGPLEAYAAAELFKTTGENGWDEAFRARGPFSGGDTSFRLEDWQENAWIPALWAYATADGGDAGLRGAAADVIVARARSWTGWGGRNGFRFVKHPYAPVAFGALTTPREAGVLVRAHALTGDPSFLAWTIHACDYTLGGNPYGRSWVTGVGARRVEHPLHTPSLADDIPEPVPGLTVFGPWNKTSDPGIANEVLKAFAPPPTEWPLAERFADVAYAPPMNEFTVHESIAPTLFAFGFLAALAPEDPLPPADVDTGARDAGAYDAGAHDAGPHDAGDAHDAGETPDTGGAEIFGAEVGGPGGDTGGTIGLDVRAPFTGADADAGSGGGGVSASPPPVTPSDGGGCAAGTAPGTTPGAPPVALLALALLVLAVRSGRRRAGPRSAQK